MWRSLSPKTISVQMSMTIVCYYQKMSLHGYSRSRRQYSQMIENVGDGPRAVAARSSYRPERHWASATPKLTPATILLVMTKLSPYDNVWEAKILPGESYPVQAGRGAGREPFRSCVEWLQRREDRCLRCRAFVNIICMNAIQPPNELGQSTRMLH